MAFKMKMKEYGKGKNPIQMKKNSPMDMGHKSPAEMKGETPTKFLKGAGQKIKGAMKKGGAGALIGGALLGPLGAAAGAAIQRRRNKKKAAAAGGEGANQWFRIILKEGRNREIRRLVESQNLKVSRLIRTRYGPLNLPSHLKRGQFMELEKKNLEKIFKLLGMS